MPKDLTKTELRQQLKEAKQALEAAAEAFLRVEEQQRDARNTFLILLAVLAGAGPGGVRVTRHTLEGIGMHLTHLSYEVVGGLDENSDDYLVRLLYDGEPPSGPSPIVTVN